MKIRIERLEIEVPDLVEKLVQLELAREDTDAQVRGSIVSLLSFVGTEILKQVVKVGGDDPGVRDALERLEQLKHPARRTPVDRRGLRVAPPPDGGAPAEGEPGGGDGDGGEPPAGNGG